MATLSTVFEELTEERVSVRSATRFYHPELDILRFFAFLLVFLHHSIPHVDDLLKLGVPLSLARVIGGLQGMGAFGVDVFFALSAYLITELLLREKEQLGTVDVPAFYARRILRIWPLYFAFLGFAIALQWVTPSQKIGWGAGAAFTFLAGNWWLVFKGFPSSIIFPLWSVSIEEQFYVMWPQLTKRLSERGMAIAAGAMLVIATSTRIYLGAHHAWETQVWCNTFARLDPIALGVLAAIYLRGAAPKYGAKMRVSLIAASVVLMALAANYWQIKGDPLTTARIVLGYPAVALGSIALLLAALRETPFLQRSALVYLGRISYGLYVFHVMGLWMSDYIVHDSMASVGRYALRVAVAATITLAFSAASYQWLEKPFLRMKARFTHVLSRPGG